MPTLNPADHEVYRVSVEDGASLTKLLSWYSGLASADGTPEPTQDSLEQVIDVARRAKSVEEEVMLRAIKTRRGQPEFRQALMSAYRGECCVTGCRVEEVLEAAHIVPHSSETDYSVANGLLLRADVHTLFDLRLVTIDESYRISISSALLGSEYGAFDGRRIKLPSSQDLWPSSTALLERLPRRNLEYGKPAPGHSAASSDIGQVATSD